jgi:large subunit ribosomal protein L4
MLKVNAYSAKGVAGEPYSLPKDWEEKDNLELLAQAMRVYEESSHIGLAKSKTRGEINRTTKKWYKQKGTGGARHGARSAPIFVGGGTAHGPHGVRRILELPQKMKQKALRLALNLKCQAKEIVTVSGMDSFRKTKEIAGLLNKIDGKSKRFTLVLDSKNLKIRKIAGNLEKVQIIGYPNLNAYNVLLGGMIILDQEIFTKK